MSLLGRVTQAWRYPVKSMGGERVARVDIAPRGIVGDRGWAIRDEAAGEIRGAKKLPGLMRCTAAYVGEPTAETVPAAEMCFPDGSRVLTTDASAASKLSELLRRTVTIWPLLPESAHDHYRRGLPDDPDMLAELRQIFGRTEDEPLPDLSVFPAEIMEFTSPLGTYFDAFPLHVLTTATLATLEQRTPGSHFDVRRFRPNLVIEPAGDAQGLVEIDWCDKVLSIGAAKIKIETPCVRCVMTTLPQGELTKDPAVLRTIVREAAQSLGVYATVVEPGVVCEGDPVSLA